MFIAKSGLRDNMDTVFLILALFFMSIMETIEHHFYCSIFELIQSDFWYEFFKSNKSRFNLFDAYHISKWLMIICFYLTAVYMTSWEWLGIQFLFLTFIMHKIFYENIWLQRHFKYWSI
jgi:hypothetical protein